MAHKVGRKVAKAVGVPSDLTKWKPMDFAKGIGLGLGGGALLSGMGGMSGITGLLGKGAGLLKSGVGYLAKNPKMLGMLGGILGGGGGGGGGVGGGGGAGGATPYGSFEGNPYFQSLMDQQNKMQQMQTDYMDPNSTYNQTQKGEMMDQIGFGNQLQNRNLAASGIDPSSGIGLQHSADAFNKGSDQFLSNINKRMPTAFNMANMNLSNQSNLFENEQNRMNANTDLMSSQAMMNAFNQQQNQTNWGEVAGQVLPGLMGMFGNQSSSNSSMWDQRM